jgi:hypothetical protein
VDSTGGGSAAAAWWEILAALGPVAILLAALITGVLAWINLRHRREAEQRSEWWSRAQWALDAAISGDPKRQQQGLALLRHLNDSELAGVEESAILENAWSVILGEKGSIDPRDKVRDDKQPMNQHRESGMSTKNVNKDQPERGENSIPERRGDEERVRILAARLRMSTDRKQNKPTPEWVRNLADRPL